MSSYIHISKFSTLNFEPENKKSFEDDVVYIQKLNVNDDIRIQFAADYEETFSWKIINEYGFPSLVGTFDSIDIDQEIKMHEVVISGLNEGIYSFNIYQTTVQENLISKSSLFCVTEETENTTILSYIHKKNDYDTIFINEEEKIFNFRIEGGFLNKDMKHMIDSENFRNQFQISSQLYQMPYKQKTLLIGSAKGVPEWVAEKINFILCCSNVYVNRVKHVRSENSTPEISIIDDKYPLFNYKILLEGEPEIYTYGVRIFSDEWIVKESNWFGYGTWKTNGIWNRN